MNINPRALLMFAVAATIGYLIGGGTGAAIGFAVAGTVSLLAG